MKEERETLKVALIGNPNSGKTSLFNKLTGLHQKVGNFPGITVEKKSGQFTSGDRKVNLVDFPGTYSLQPRSMDEEVAARALLDSDNPDHPDLVLIIVDASHLKTSLYLVLQVLEQKVPAILVLNMADQLSRLSSKLDLSILSETLNVPVLKTNARDGKGVNELKEIIASHSLELPTITWDSKAEKHQVIKEVLRKANGDGAVSAHELTKKLDDVLTHRIFGVVFFLSLLGLMF
ncbi:MAG: ferrous iron transport protein B, partial [Bacteroidia bacterium]